MIIGIIGRSCSGKDRVAHILEEKGISSLNCDEVGHEVLETLGKEVAEAFGEEVLTEGKPDRKKLGPVVFASPEKLRKLEELTHPAIIGRIHELERRHPLITVNGALLERAGIVKLCKEIVFVYAPLETRMERALARDGITKERFLARNSNQQDVGLSLFCQEKPVYTILNDGDEDYLYRQVQSYCDRLALRGYIL